jgi:hypothetical protein
MIILQVSVLITALGLLRTSVDSTDEFDLYLTSVHLKSTKIICWSPKKTVFLAKRVPTLTCLLVIVLKDTLVHASFLCILIHSWHSIFFFAQPTTATKVSGALILRVLGSRLMVLFLLLCLHSFTVSHSAHQARLYGMELSIEVVCSA